jgi:hypothetical protein
MIGKPSSPVRREAARKRTSPHWHLAARPTHPAWITSYRRTVRDYERLPASHEAMILWAMIALMTHRLTPQAE